MRQKLFRKYVLATGTVVLVCLTVIMALLTVFYSRNLASEKYSTLDRACESISEFINDVPNDRELNSPDRGLYYVMDNLARVSDIDLFVTDKEGVIRNCICSERLTTGKCNHVGAVIDIKKLKKADKSNMLSNLNVYKSPHYVAAYKLKSKGNFIGYTVATSSAVQVIDMLKKTARIYFISAIVPIVIMFAVLYFLAYRFTKPLKLMSEAARAMANGDFSRRIPVTTDDEIGELAISFNDMTNSLARLEETRKDFIANVSHELKTPMTTIGGFIDGIIDGTVEPDKQEHYLTLVSDEVKRLSRMVDSMLNVSRIESKEFSLKYELFDFKEMLIGVVIGQEQRIEEKMCEIIGLDELPAAFIKADKDLIYRVIYNLVDNAVKFTNQNGKITFSLRLDSKKLFFKIENTGKGIKKSDLPFIFEKFYKGDKSRSAVKDSTGLGLYLVKTIIKNHGGNITVTSVEDDFTAFSITLPKRI